jgi:hypothetical protein
MKKIAIPFIALLMTMQAWSAERTLVDMQVFPKDINLTTSRDRQSIVVQVTWRLATVFFSHCVASRPAFQARP